MRLLEEMLLIAFIAGCAAVPKTEAPVPDKPAPQTSLAQLKTFTHADLQAAAAYAERGCNTDPTKVNPQQCFPTRAAKIRAFEGMLTAAEGQAAACKAALLGLVPAKPPEGAGVFLLTEMAAETLGSAQPAQVRIICEDIVLPFNLLPAPRL